MRVINIVAALLLVSCSTGDDSAKLELDGPVEVMDPLEGCLGVRVQVRSCDIVVPLGASTSTIFGRARRSYVGTLQWWPSSGPVIGSLDHAPDEIITLEFDTKLQEPECGNAIFWHVKNSPGQNTSGSSGHCHERLEVDGEIALRSSLGTIDERWSGKITASRSQCDTTRIEIYRFGESLDEMSGSIDSNSFTIDPNSGWTMIGFDLQSELEPNCEENDETSDEFRGRLMLHLLDPSGEYWMNSVGNWQSDLQ
jgi:hypothetical protein